MENLTLEDLSSITYTLSTVQCDFLSENCIVALENNNHANGCKLSVIGDIETVFELLWKRQVNKKGYKELKKIIEHAAEAISFFLSRKLTNYSVVEEALIGTGIDYWLGYDEKDAQYNPKNFLQARLEISGINKEKRKGVFKNRIQIKKKQAKRSDVFKLPVYISVVEFATPKAYFGRK